MRILIAAGGTGGHIFPAISLARELERSGFSDIIFIVDDNIRAKEMIRESGFELKVLKVPKMPYGISVKWLSFFARVFLSQLKARRIIAETNPDIAVGFGAYIAGVTISAAKSMGKKTLIHEQNAFLGRANRLLINKADRVCLSFNPPSRNSPPVRVGMDSERNSASTRFFRLYIERRWARPRTAIAVRAPRRSEKQESTGVSPWSFNNSLLGKDKKYILTGNPIRQSLLNDHQELTKEEALSHLSLSPQKKTLLVLGGSSGASAINKLMVDLAKGLKGEDKEIIQIIHITGDKDLELVSTSYRDCAITHWVKGFYGRMGLLYKAADLILCRCGATTVAEICLFGIPAILIPYPGAGSHQEENAAVITEAGGAITLKQEDAAADRLKKLILDLLNDETRAGRMSGAMRSLARPDATLRLTEAVEELSNAG